MKCSRNLATVFVSMTLGCAGATGVAADVVSDAATSDLGTVTVNITPIGAATPDAAAPDVGGRDASGHMFHVSGVAYGFGGSGKVLEGVTIEVLEDPAMKTISNATGRYTIDVPDGAPFTLQAKFDGYATMALQTFTTWGKDVELLNFQMVENVIFEAFSQVLGATLDPEKCQIASTVGVKALNTLTFEEFIAFGAQGMEGVTVYAEPAIPGVVYFNASTIPDKTLTATSKDGGIVWANVTPGVYTIHATHPTHTFETFVATCAKGRFINANPPWGLREK